jgi:hypothetical protein
MIGEVYVDETIGQAVQHKLFRHYKKGQQTMDDDLWTGHWQLRMISMPMYERMVDER